MHDRSRRKPEERELCYRSVNKTIRIMYQLSDWRWSFVCTFVADCHIKIPTQATAGTALVVFSTAPRVVTINERYFQRSIFFTPRQPFVTHESFPNTIPRLLSLTIFTILRGFTTRQRFHRSVACVQLMNPRVNVPSFSVPHCISVFFSFLFFNYCFG